MSSIAPVWLWGFFVLSVLAALFIDFVVLKKQGAHEVSVKEAIRWSLLWVALSLAFNALFWWALTQSPDSAVVAQADTRAMEFLTGYLIEKSLAVDNIFIFLMIFTYFAVPPAYQKRVLMLGIVGAIVLRTVMILVGSWLIAQFHWVLYVFGAFLLLTGIKMWWAAGKEQSLDDNPALKLMRRMMPVSKNFDGEKFLHHRERQAHRHAAAHGGRTRGHHGCDLRGRLDPGHLCHHRRSVHRAHLEHLRDPRPARHVLPAGPQSLRSSTC